VSTAGAPATPPWPPSLNELRLIPPDAPLGLAAHLGRYGPLVAGDSGRMIAEIERSGLTGRGGGGFPAGRKLLAVAEAVARGRRRAVVVANASESEPASSKDTVLLRSAPHLILDGIAAAAAMVGADRAYLCLGERAQPGTGELAAAIAERARARLDEVPLDLAQTAAGYLAGQETALISTLNGGLAKPTLVPPHPSARGAHRQPTLVMNVETLAHVALIARYGANWFRQLGTPAAAGSALVTISGAVTRPGVYEVSLGTRLGDLLDRAMPAEAPQAVLIGGYFGSWLPVPAALGAPLSNDGLKRAGAGLGPGVVAVLPQSRCGLAETARVTGYLASQIAGQCGPCRNGMPAIAEAMNWIAFGRPGGDLIGWTQQLTRLISGRGACHLPDGAAALITSALRVFDADLQAHAAAGPCARATAPPMLPLPRTRPGWAEARPAKSRRAGERR
jgi:NADH:ubiquinone oxidoreductase subunit F (NADH-binding)